MSSHNDLGPVLGELARARRRLVEAAVRKRDHHRQHRGHQNEAKGYQEHQGDAPMTPLALDLVGLLDQRRLGDADGGEADGGAAVSLGARGPHRVTTAGGARAPRSLSGVPTTRR